MWIQVLAATGVQGMLEKLADSNGLLDKINKGLNAYLEKKRLFFPRCVYIYIYYISYEKGWSLLWNG